MKPDMRAVSKKRFAARGGNGLRDEALALILPETVVKFSQADAELRSRRGATAVVFLQRRENVIPLENFQGNFVARLLRMHRRRHMRARGGGGAVESHACAIERELQIAERTG